VGCGGEVSFTCMECGGAVELVAKAGRMRVVEHGITLEIPANIPLPTCAACDEVYINKHLGERIDATLTARPKERW
jgi:NMD protein affecting ribosome stability and mRNA decay